jgi:L-ascorbate metabolism protein UlaG (beta-lactamase superfamily)
MQIHVTHLGTATLLLEIGSLRLVTDPVLGAAGRTYSFGFGTRSTHMETPAGSRSALGKVDAVLLSHDQHADNLDDEGRCLLPHASQVFTTVSGARRLGGNARGLGAWETGVFESKDLRLQVTATPARHGPPLSRPMVGDVVGFVLEWPGQEHGALYISGDTVLFEGVLNVGKRFRVGTAFLHHGGVQFPISGPIRYTLHAEDAVKLADGLNPSTIIPVHYDGWTHFREPVSTCQAVWQASKHAGRVCWLVKGERTALVV